MWRPPGNNEGVGERGGLGRGSGAFSVPGVDAGVELALVDGVIGSADSVSDITALVIIRLSTCGI